MKIQRLNEKAYTYYTNGIKTIKVKPGDIPPEGFYPGQHYKKVPWNKGLTAETDERVKLNTEKAHQTRKQGNYPAWNKGLTAETDERVAKNINTAKQTMLDRYGVENPAQLPSHKAWNTGLTKDTNDSVKKISDANKGKTAWNKGLSIPGHPHSEETKQHLSQVHSSDEVKLRKYNSLKRNGNLGRNSNTKPELEYYEYLLTKYKPEDIIQQYMDKRYPFKCDFYIIPEDKFIEIHAGWTHGGHPFDRNNPEDIKKLNLWKEKSEEHPYFKNAIYTWTDLDIRKVEVAKKNHLNFEVIY